MINSKTKERIREEFQELPRWTILPTFDSAISGVLLGVVSNGLWALFSNSAGTAIREIKKVVVPPSDVELTAIQAAFKGLTKSQKLAGQFDKRVLTFLRAPETEAVVRQVFATTLVNPKESHVTFDSIRRGFVVSMSRSLDVDEDRLRPVANAFFDAVVSRTQETLKAAVGKNLLSAHEAQSAVRHRMLLDEISNVQKNIAFLTSKPALDIPAILKFEEKYRELIALVHGSIKPPHLESGRKVPIDEIFVSPNISWLPRTKGADAHALSLGDFLPRIHRTVLLGNPGGGKSTTSSKICYDLSARYDERLFAGREITPAIVVLREYGSQKKISNCSIVQFLEQQANSRYQLKPPNDAFEYLLLNGRMSVVFDGLDELLDTTYRQEITSNVETFCKLYPSVPVLVTSREVGYEQAPLEEKVFEQYRLAPFSSDQVKDYATKWFGRDEDYTPEQRSQKANAFFADSTFVSDLRSNPLMLGLMCNLYRAEGYIPRNRPEVYGKCSIMLFERWDKGRDILVPLPFEEHIRPAMQDLAFWIYENPSLQGGVTEHELIERTANYLCKWVFDDSCKAHYAASDFIRFCTGRAWVFTDTGTTREGEKLFQFTHRTFLEYFTACYLVSVNPSPENLLNELRPRIMKSEWDVVAQLSFQIQSKQVQGAADELLKSLLAHEYADIEATRNVLSFAERSLEFLVPSPKVRRDVVQAALTFWLDQVTTEIGSERRLGRPDRSVTDHVGNVMLASAENRNTVADAMRQFLIDALASDRLPVAHAAGELILDLRSTMQRHEHDRPVPVDAAEFWRTFQSNFVSEAGHRLKKLAETDQCIALRGIWSGLVRLDSAVQVFGIPFLVTPILSTALGGVLFYPAGFRLVDFALGIRQHPSSADQEKVANELEYLADIFLQTPVPWVGDVRRLGPTWGPRGLSQSLERRRFPAMTLSPAANFSLICLLAIDLEGGSLRKEPDRYSSVLREEDVLPHDIKVALSGRFLEETFWAQDGLDAINRFDFSEGQKSLLERWVKKEVDFVAKSRRPRTSAPKRPATKQPSRQK